MTPRLVVLAATLAPALAAAHPLGTVSTNRWAALEASPGRLEVRHGVALAELPAFRELHGLAIVARARAGIGA